MSHTFNDTFIHSMMSGIQFLKTCKLDDTPHNVIHSENIEDCSVLIPRF
jgi:hypothetical protein